MFDAYIPTAGKSVSFITDQDSIRFYVKPGDYHQVILLINGKDSAFTAIKGILDVPSALSEEAFSYGMETLSLPNSITLLSIRKVKSPNILR